MGSEGSAELGGTYILTLDLGEKLEAFRRIGINAPGPHDDYTQDIQKDLARTISASLPNATLEDVYMTDLSDDVIGVTSKLLSQLEDPLIVSSCPEIAHPSGGKEIEINRLINFKGELLGLGPRPGHAQIEDQIRDIRPAASNRGVVIVEDGIFTGGTVKHLIQKFEEAHIRVKAVVAGFNCAQSDTSWFESNGYDLVTAKTFEKIIDWVPDHDFFPFIPGSGKVIGVNANDKYLPFYDHRNASYSVPYIEPFAPMNEWASIPETQTRKVSNACILLAMDIFKTIEKRNSGDKIQLKHLLSTRQRASLPMQLNHDHFPPLEVPVTTYLAEMM